MILIQIIAGACSSGRNELYYTDTYESEGKKMRDYLLISQDYVYWMYSDGTPRRVSKNIRENYSAKAKYKIVEDSIKFDFKEFIIGSKTVSNNKGHVTEKERIKYDNEWVSYSGKFDKKEIDLLTISHSLSDTMHANVQFHRFRGFK